MRTTTKDKVPRPDTTAGAPLLDPQLAKLLEARKVRQGETNRGNELIIQ